MKKEYLKPHIKVSALMYELSLLDGTRSTGGGVVNPGDDGPSVNPGINETGEGTDPYAGHGSGTGGGGNRSKSYNVWEY